MPAHLTRPARHDKMVGLVETTLKLHVRSMTLTADILRLAAPDGCSTGNTPEPLAVSRKLEAVEAQVNPESAKLWNLSAADLAEIQRSLNELQA